MNKPGFVYVTYIATTPEKLFKALTDGEATRQYWRHDNVSDWKVGSTWEHRRSDGEKGTVDVVGKVVESVPPKRLVVTWARPSEADDTARHSRVTFEIEPQGPAVRLIVTHDQLEGDDAMARSVSGGWPLVLSNLKSYLETGRAIPNLW
jgi:uncharacterized protein YndB with AHSA1/START domain